MKDSDVQPIVPTAGQVWLYRQPAEGNQRACEFRVRVLSADVQSKRVVVANDGLSWTETMWFSELRGRATLIGTTDLR